MKSIHIPACTVPVADEVDLCVCGGSCTGVFAAVAAARQGLRVALVEANGFLGGSATAAFVPVWHSLFSTDGETQIIGGLTAEVLETLYRRGEAVFRARTDPAVYATFSTPALQFALDRVCDAEEPRLRLFLHATVTGAVLRAPGELSHVLIADKSGSRAIAARFFIDATGDGALSMLAGCAFQLGRERDHLCQPMTLCFRIADVDCEAYSREYAGINELYQKFRREGKIKNPREDILTFRMLVGGVVHFNSTRIVKRDPTDAFDLTRAELEAREQLFELYTFLRDNTEAFRNSTLLASASSIGVRESRMIDGEYLLTGKDLTDCVKFEDSIALGNYDIDIHNPEGTGTSHYYFPEGQYYTIPYRALIPRGSENLLVAGRCISVDHEAQASIRIMPTVCCLGEAAGCAAGLAASAGCSVRDVVVARLHELLARNTARF